MIYYWDCKCGARCNTAQTCPNCDAKAPPAPASRAATAGEEYVDGALVFDGEHADRDRTIAIDTYNAGHAAATRGLAERLEMVRIALESIADGSEGFSYREYTGPHGEGVSETNDANKVAAEALATLTVIIGELKK